MNANRCMQANIWLGVFYLSAISKYVFLYFSMTLYTNKVLVSHNKLWPYVLVNLIIALLFALHQSTIVRDICIYVVGTLLYCIRPDLITKFLLTRFILKWFFRCICMKINFFTIFFHYNLNETIQPLKLFDLHFLSPIASRKNKHSSCKVD